MLGLQDFTDNDRFAKSLRIFEEGSIGIHRLGFQRVVIHLDLMIRNYRMSIAGSLIWVLVFSFKGVFVIADLFIVLRFGVGSYRFPSQRFRNFSDHRLWHWSRRRLLRFADFFHQILKRKRFPLGLIGLYWTVVRLLMFPFSGRLIDKIAYDGDDVNNISQVHAGKLIESVRESDLWDWEIEKIARFKL